MFTPVVLDGEPDIVEVQVPSIKLRQTPTLVIAIPCGTKDTTTVLRCPKHLGGCGQAYQVPSFSMPQMLPAEYVLKKDNMAPPLNMVTATMVVGGRLSSEARQIMTKKAIRMGAKYILYMDDDTITSKDGKGLYNLVNFLERYPTIGAVSGVVPTRVDPPEPVVYKEHGGGAFWDLPMGPGAVPQPIYAAGAAFMLARLSAVNDVIERMKADNGGVEIAIWTDERSMPGELAGGKDTYQHIFGHDVRFCRLMNEHGYPVYAHGDVQCGHYDIMSGITYWVPEDAPGFLGPRDLPKAAPEKSESTDEHPSVDVIVVKYNYPELEENTIKAVKENTEYPNYTLTTHTNPKGVSLAKCWNDLIRSSSAKYICLLNSDTTVARGWLTKLMKYVAKDNVGAVVPSSNKVHMSQIDTPLELFEMDYVKINDFAATLDEVEPESLSLASCMCAVFPKSVWMASGGFDEDFQLYGEDTEFFWRLKNKLQKDILWVKDAYVHHYKGQSVTRAIETEGLDIEALRARSFKLFTEKTGLELVSV